MLHKVDPFWNEGEKFFDLQDITPKDFYHKIQVAMDGTVLAFLDDMFDVVPVGGDVGAKDRNGLCRRFFSY